MNWESIQGVCAVAALLGNVISFLLIRPLLKERAENSKLKDRITEMVHDSTESRFTGHGRVLSEHEDRIGELETLHAGAEGAALKVFMTRADFEKHEELSTHQRELMNRKLDQGLINDAEQNAKLKGLQLQLDRVLDRWDMEHRKT